MVESVIFSGLSSLDFQEIRSNVTRIPEVIKRIREAQAIWDSRQGTHFDLLNFICSDNKTFYSNIHLKSLASGVVQVGLFDRYLRFQKKPDFIVGNYNGNSVLKVAIGEVTFEELVVKSAAVLNTDLQIHEVINKESETEPILSGISLTEYAAFQWNKEQEVFLKVTEGQIDISGIIHTIVEDYQVRKIVNIGPGHFLVSRSNDDLILEEVQILESIDLDPMLSWFWSSMREPASA